MVLCLQETLMETQIMHSFWASKTEFSLPSLQRSVLHLGKKALAFLDSLTLFLQFSATCSSMSDSQIHPFCNRSWTQQPCPEISPYFPPPQPQLKVSAVDKLWSPLLSRFFGQLLLNLWTAPVWSAVLPGRELLDVSTSGAWGNSALMRQAHALAVPCRKLGAVSDQKAWPESHSCAWWA